MYLSITLHNVCISCLARPNRRKAVTEVVKEKMGSLT
jgi:hypothetical protein